MTARRHLLVLNATGAVSGAERVLLQAVEAATAQGWQVTGVCPDGPLATALTDLGVRRVAVPELGLAAGFRPVAVMLTLARWLGGALRLRRAARTADVVVANSLLALPVVRLARLGCATAWLAHDVVVHPGRQRLYARCCASLDRVIAVSQAVASQLQHVGGGRPRIVVVHNGVDTPVSPVRPTSAPPVIGISAVLAPWKGHDVLLDAVPLLDPEVRVEIMGGTLPKDGDHARHVAARASAATSGGRVRVLGHVADPLEQMRGWTVAVSASVEPEACPLAVLEGMSLGLPVVATDHGGAPEVLADAGTLVPPGDPQALADAVHRLLGDAGLRERLGARGRELVAQHHDPARQLSALLDALGDLAAEGRTGRHRVEGR